MVHHDFQPEASTTPVTTDADVALTSGNRAYSIFTLPTTYDYYMISGIEWENGTTLDGSVRAGVDIVNADPITLAAGITIAWGSQDLQSGSGSVQRTRDISSQLVAGGTIMGAWVVSNSATATFGSDTVGAASDPIRRAIAFTSDGNHFSTTSYTSSVERFYIKIYYIGVG